MIGRIQRTPAPVRWSLALLWTGGLLYLMLTPSGDGTPVTWISRLFGGTEITDAIGHVILYAVLTALWAWTLSLHMPERRAILTVAALGLILGLTLEAAQVYVEDRGSTLIDYGANMAGVLGSSVVLLWRNNRS